MNIFNWVHRRFNQNADGYTLRKKDKLSRGDEINKEVITNDADTEALLVNGWNDGILSIGTFGFDPLKPANIECEEIPEEKKDVAMSTDPLVQNVSVKQEVVKVSCFNPSANVVKCDPIRVSLDESDTLIIRLLDLAHIFEPDMDIKKRTTLAELFAAHGNEIAKNEDFVMVSPIPEKKETCGTKRDVSSLSKEIKKKKKKKTTAPKGESSTTIMKLNKLVKKILTKKIHPAHEANIRASGSLFAANITNTTLADGCKYGFNTEKSIGELNCLL